MKIRRITALIIAFSMLFGIMSPAVFAEDSETIVIHVSANAPKASNGTAERPYKTVDAAQKALRLMNHKKSKVEILIHAGTYHFDRSLQFEVQDSGSEKYPVVYKAAGDGEVLFTGSTKLDVMDFSAVTDKAVLARLPKASRDRVGVMSLEKYELNPTLLSIIARYTDSKTLPPLAYLYLNGKRQSVSRWPNVGFQNINTVIAAGDSASSKTGKQGIFKYNTLQPEKWLFADQAFVVGYLGTEYCLDWVTLAGVDTENKTILTGTPSNYGVKAGHRWYIANLLEEIDCPGEFFIDVNNMLLYFYPPQKLNRNDVLEICAYNESFITLTEASHIVFDGITFRHTLNTGIVINNSSNITIRNCTMQNIGLNGIQLLGANNLIEGNTIYETGRYCIQLRGGGDPATLTPSANRIANNHLYNFATLNNMLYKTAIDLGRESGNKTIGDVVEYNIIHGQPNAYGIIYGGLDNIIRYNELFSVTNDAADMGVIYSGRKLNEFGNLIQYNYIHDYAPSFTARYQIQGIYWDDLQSGQTAKNNIIVAGNKNRTTGDLIVGAYNNFSENVVVNSDIGYRMGDRVGNVSTTAYDSLTSAGVTEAVLKKYPQITKLKEQLDRDNMFFNVQDNIMNNNLSVDVNSNSIHDNVAKRAISIENNHDTDDYSVFVDPENHDYRLTTEAMELYGFPETMINENNFEMSMIGIQKDVFDVQTPETEFRLLYPANGQKNVIRNKAFLKWEEALFADRYEYIVAKDPELKDVVVQGTTQYTFAELNELENNQTYYYKVYATCLSKQIGNRWESLGVPYMFTTSESDELETQFLKQEIDNIKKLREGIVTGDGLGEYKPEVLTDMDNLLKEADVLASMTKGQQTDIDDGITRLKNFGQLIGGYKHSGHKALPVDGEWLTQNETTLISKTEDGVRIESGGAGLAYINQPLNNYESHHFRMKVDIKGWVGLSLRQKDLTIMPYKSSNTAYLIVIKPDMFEVQKYNPAAATTGIINTYTNTHIKSGEWYDIEFGAVDVVGGVEVILKVNGETVFSFFDTEQPNFEEGYFTVYPGSVGSVVEFAAPSSVPEGEYEFIGADNDVSIYGSDSNIFASTGIWYDSKVKSVNNTPIKLSDEMGATASYTITDTITPYKVAYYQRPVEGADKNATIKVKFYSTTTGDIRELTFKADFESDKEGWVELGTFMCASAGLTGSIIVEFTGSGEGAAVAPVISAQKVTEEEYNFARIFYEDADGLLAMKLGNKNAYKNGIKLEIADTAPYAEDGVTLVPVRFVSEAFDANVEWNGSENKVTVTNGDTVIEFVLGEQKYMVNGTEYESAIPAKAVNGRTMIPLRALGEALGKKVLWCADYSVILIANDLSFGEDDSAKLNLINSSFGK